MGDLERTSLLLLRRVAGAVGVSLPLAPRWRGAELAKLLDEKHAAMVREVVARLAPSAGLRCPSTLSACEASTGR